MFKWFSSCLLFKKTIINLKIFEAEITCSEYVNPTGSGRSIQHCLVLYMANFLRCRFSCYVGNIQVFENTQQYFRNGIKKLIVTILVQKYDVLEIGVAKVCKIIKVCPRLQHHHKWYNMPAYQKIINVVVSNYFD